MTANRVAKLTEIYQCQKCQKKFKGTPGRQVCPFCNNNYVTWLTFEIDWVYDEVLKQWKKEMIVHNPIALNTHNKYGFQVGDVWKRKKN